MRAAHATGLSDTLNDGTVTGDELTTEDTPVDTGEGRRILDMCRQALSDSTTYLDTNWRQQWEDNHDNFQSRHPKGSLYHKPAFKHRSKLFLPKIRAVGMRWEAAASSALFSTKDIVSIEAENQDDPNQAIAARLWKEAFEYRLGETMPWYLTVLGAAQDAYKTGICISHNHWKYAEDEKGNILVDSLACDNVPVENFRFSPSADWRMVVKDSPYLIHIMTFRADEVVGKMRNGEWIQSDQKRIKAATRPFQTNFHDETDADTADTVDPHETVYVYKYIMRLSGVDYQWYVLGMESLLTAPTPLSEINPEGMRNYTIGMSTFDTHQAMPQAPIEHMASLQADINETRNSRKDNVRQVLNKRVFVKRGAGIDTAALLRNVPGAVIPTTDPIGDVREADMSDVTASSYKEEEFSNAAFDEIAGSFNQSSINTNRRMGETAAGMELMAADSNIMTEYKLEVFVQTWVLPTLKQLLTIEQHFDRDWMVISKAAQQAQLAEAGIVEITENLLMQGVKMSVSVGVDATNPSRKVDKLNIFANSMMNFGMQPNGEEFTKEIAGAMGFDNGSRFIGEPPPAQEDPMTALKQAEMQMKQEIAQMQHQEAQIKLQIAQGQLDMQSAKTAEDGHIKQLALQVTRDDNDADRESRERIAQMQDSTQREIAGLNAEIARQKAIIDGKAKIEGLQVQREANVMSDNQTRKAVELQKTQQPASE